MNLTKINILIILLFISHCTLNKPIKHHGINNLEKKSKKLMISESNINDIKKILGPPSSVSFFDNENYIYLEKKTSNSRFLKLGKKKILVNKVLLLEIDNRGLLISKTLLNKNDLKKISFSERNTTVDYDNETLVYKSLSSIRRKINDPLGKKRGSATIND
jgi:outer membrane protein assembly factor BamE (lipoprotein component of BamABCDE complex)